MKDSYKDAFRDGHGSLPRLTVQDANRNSRVSDLWVKNGDFLRISNLQVGYTLPQAIANKLSIQKARVYLGVQNLLTILVIISMVILRLVKVLFFTQVLIRDVILCHVPSWQVLMLPSKLRMIK